jgi:hypothetical protein|tara:strand:+ start:219 stop:992 length:774 start_codon:yes stop_codon:yes gene_type:complete
MQNPYGSQKDRVTVGELEKVATPAPDGIWNPIPHTQLLGMVRNKIEDIGMKVIGEDHILSRFGQRYFGMLWVNVENDQSTKMIGVRNAHDKSVAAAICGGEQVTVCANMLFQGEIMVARKHTTNILSGLSDRIGTALSDIRGLWKDHDARMDRYRDGEILSHRDADSIVMEAFRRGGVKKTQVVEVSDLYRNPPHSEFEGRNAYNMLQAFTETWKGSTNSLNELPQKSSVVTNLLDGYLDNPRGFNQPINVDAIGNN